MAYVDADPSELLHRARMQAGLTQGEVAARADVSRQMVSAYERGARHPSIATLESLLAGCGVRLRLDLVPEPGLEDAPTWALLNRPPIERLSAAHQDAVLALAWAGGGAEHMLLAGKAGARLHGAVVAVPELEFVVNPGCPAEQIAQLLNSAGAEYLDREGAASAVSLTSVGLRGGCSLVLSDVDVVVRSYEHYDGMRQRCVSVPVSATKSIWTASSRDCPAFWMPRDLDHLALQRVWRLLEEGADAARIQSQS